VCGSRARDAPKGPFFGFGERTVGCLKIVGELEHSQLMQQPSHAYLNHFVGWQLEGIGDGHRKDGYVDRMAHNVGEATAIQFPKIQQVPPVGAHEVEEDFHLIGEWFDGDEIAFHEDINKPVGELESTKIKLLGLFSQNGFVTVLKASTGQLCRHGFSSCPYLKALVSLQVGVSPVSQQSE